MPDSQFSQLNGLKFTEPDTAWRDFVLGNRSGTLTPHGYAHVSGPVLRNLDRGTAWPYPAYNQTSLHTQAAATVFNRSLR